MNRRRWGGRTIGVAIGPAALTAFAGDVGADGWSRALEPLAATDTQWPSLVEAFRELRRTAPAHADLCVALLPPLVEVRPLTLPPLPADAARQVIARNAARYFLSAHEPQVIGLAPARPSQAKAASHGWVAAAAAARVVDAIHSAAREAGWTLRAVVPAEAAWTAAALAMWPSLRQGSHEVTVAAPERTDVLLLEDGMLAGVRRFAGRAEGLSARRDDVPVIAEARWNALTHSPVVAAAAFASRAGGFELVSESARRLRQTRRGAVTAGAAVAAAVLFIGAAAVELWGVRRELEHVSTERAALRPDVAALAATRDLAIATRGRLDELATASRTAVPWSEVLLALTRALPRDAHLLAIRASGDSLVIEGMAASAARVFTALESAPELTGIQSAAPVRRNLRDRADTAPKERFSIAARVRGPAAGRDSVPVLTASRGAR